MSPVRIRARPPSTTHLEIHTQKLRKALLGRQDLLELKSSRNRQDQSPILVRRTPPQDEVHSLCSQRGAMLQIFIQQNWQSSALVLLATASNRHTQEYTDDGFRQSISEGLFLAQFFAPDLDKVLQRPIIGLLGLRWKQTTWQFMILPVVLQTITAITLSWASRIRTLTSFLVFLNIACSASHRYHVTSLLLDVKT
jgi:hypothetical protein